MSNADDWGAHSRRNPETHQRNADKLRRIPIRVVATETKHPKPDWIRARLGNHSKVSEIKRILRENNLHSVCEEASCPNLSECFTQGTATFMILGDLCTRRCPFCDVAHGRPTPPSSEEPVHLAQTIAALRLRYVVITSVNRDDLRDGGALHFSQCIQAVRQLSPTTCIEILTPDFRGRQALALDQLEGSPPDVFNHNLETVPRLYQTARPGADYETSLGLLKSFKTRHPSIPTKSGLMLGLGETYEEITQVMRDLRSNDCNMLTIGQYLQPSSSHHPVTRYAPPEEFAELGRIAESMGFEAVSSGPMVRSSYHADQQAKPLLNQW